MAELKTKSKQDVFNPVKEDKDGVLAKRMIWSTKSLEIAINGIIAGKKLLANPFYEKNTSLLKGDLVFDRTEEEIQEWLKCKNDVLYFAEKYCKLMTPEGIKNITLRDYQKRYLQHLEKNRLSIYLSCRQSGKCLDFLQLIDIKIDKNTSTQIDGKLKKYLDNKYYIIEQDCYRLPLFELYNLFDKSFKWKILYQLYKFLYYYESRSSKTKEGTIKIIINLIYWLISKLNTDSDEKLLKSFQLEGIQVLSDEGWSEATHIHMTKPFEIYELQLENGLNLKCADEHIVFRNDYSEVFVKDLKPGDLIKTKYGDSLVKYVKQVGPSVNMCDLTVNNTKHSYYTNDVLSHNTTTSAIFMLHYILFNVDKNALVLGNKRATAIEILDKTKKIFYELPYFLKPGIYKWNESEIVLDNGCRLLTSATTKNAAIGFTLHCCLWDEAAHINPNIAEEFYSNVFPTITAARARFMITSTQNGYNLFYRLYKAAEAGESEYAAFKTDWPEVPEYDPIKKQWVKRDETWHRLQVANYGSEEAFNAQFGTNFDISANTLINQKIINKRNQRLIKFIEKEMPGVPYSDSWKWHPDFDPMECRNTYLVLTTDIAEGGGGDSTVCAVHRFIEPGTNKLECVGYFKSNTIPRENATLSIQVFVSNLCHQDRVLLSFERNIYGEMFVKQMLENTEKNVPGCKFFDESVFVKYYNEAGTKFTYGIKITSGNKTTHCMLYKEDYEKDLLINDSVEYMVELNNFSDTGNSKYAAAFGHDDMVMAEVQLTFVRETLQYKLLKDDFEAGHDISLSDTIYNAFEMFDPYAKYQEVMKSNNISQMDMYDIYNIDISNAYRRLNSM